MKIKLVLTDVDGCLTDNSVLYTATGEKIKKFNMYDGMGIRILKNNDILTGIISGDNSFASLKRAQDLNMDYIYIGIKNKKDTLYEIIKKTGINTKEIAYMGDDLQDLEIIKTVGLSVAPANAIDIVKNQVDYVTTASGGDGAFREFAEYVLHVNQESGDNE